MLIVNVACHRMSLFVTSYEYFYIK